MSTKNKAHTDKNNVGGFDEELSGVSGDGFLELDSVENSLANTEYSKVIQTRYGKVFFDSPQSAESKVLILHEAIAIAEQQKTGNSLPK